MSGEINNTNHLAAYNQVIKAIHDLQLSIETGNPPQILAVLVEAVADNVEALRTTFETRNVAQVVAQNTKFSDLIDAISAWFHKTGCGCCGGGGSYIPDSTEGIEGEPPPTNPGNSTVWTTTEGAPTQTPPGTPDYYDRKCKIANGLVEDVMGVVQVAYDMGVPQLGFDLAFVVMGYAVGELTTPILALDGVVGAAAGLVLAVTLSLLDAGVDLPALIVGLPNKNKDLVCALYSSTSHTDALLNFKTVLSDAGV